MSARIAATEQPKTRRGTRPLATDAYRRDPDVEAEIGRLLGLPTDRLLAVSNEQDGAIPPMPESLVYFLREAHRRGDDGTRWALTELLIKRSARVIAAVADGAPPNLRTDCEQDIVVAVVEALSDLGAGNAFWEVRFWVCVKRRALKVLSGCQNIAAVEMQPFEPGDGDGTSGDFFDQRPDERIASQVDLMEARQALAILPIEEYRAFVLFYYWGLAQDLIAKREGVSDRTVRNRLRSAEERLAAWRLRFEQDERHG